MNLSSFLLSVADLLRGKVILPFTVLRRMDCVLQPTKAAVLAELKKHHDSGFNAVSSALHFRAGDCFNDHGNYGA